MFPKIKIATKPRRDDSDRDGRHLERVARHAAVYEPAPRAATSTRSWCCRTRPWRSRSGLRGGSSTSKARRASRVACSASRRRASSRARVARRGARRGHDRAPEQVPVLVGASHGGAARHVGSFAELTDEEVLELHARCRAASTRSCASTGRTASTSAGTSVASPARGSPTTSTCTSSPLVGRHELHAGAGGREGDPRAPARDARAAARSVGSGHSSLTAERREHAPGRCGRRLPVVQADADRPAVVDDRRREPFELLAARAGRRRLRRRGSRRPGSACACAGAGSRA